MGRLITCVLVSSCLALSACMSESVSESASATTAAEQTQTLRIAAAANLSDVLPAIVEGYKTDKDLPNQDIEITFASSGKLYAQIIAGAPYDIFLSANQDFPAKLADDGAQSKQAHKPFTYAQGQLALYSTTQSLATQSYETVAEALNSALDSKITIANPELAPYGASAKSYLQSISMSQPQSLYDALEQQQRLIQAENIGQAFQYAHTGSVDYGFVAQSQITAIKAAPRQFITLAPGSYPAILQDGIIVSESSTAAEFVDYLRSDVGQQYFLQAGYLNTQ
ncbi:molybdate ABC transporter substrate-binding protein [Psychrobacter sp. F1192]|uniref:Molybdate ABC transporter substrate-binding protein n=2 Tax=Psychrobacter coccoides TaxID=2818440 RepID=A0ABS3NM76_9GAMM|nr:molybdate ABC transporter substrate-binding protein [Psychrobacter coccoides]